MLKQTIGVIRDDDYDIFYLLLFFLITLIYFYYFFIDSTTRCFFNLALLRSFILIEDNIFINLFPINFNIFHYINYIIISKIITVSLLLGNYINICIILINNRNMINGSFSRP